MTRLEELLLRLRDLSLRPEELQELERLLEDADVRRRVVEEFSWLSAVHEVLSAPKAAPAKSIRPRRALAGRRAPGRPYLLPALVAAGILFAIVVVLSVSSPGPRPEPREPKSARRGPEGTVRERDAEMPEEELPRKVRARPENTGKEDLQRKTQEPSEKPARTPREEEPRTKPPDPEERRTTEPPRAPEKAAAEAPRPEKPDTRAAVARLERVEGEAFRVVGTERRLARAGEDLLAGEGLATEGVRGGAAVVYPDKTRLAVGPGTEIKGLKVEGGKRVHVAKGTVSAEVTPQPKREPMVFDTPHGEVTVLGTTLRISVDATSTRTDVETGRVRLRRLPDGKFVDLSAGHYAMAATGVELTALSALFREDFESGALTRWKVLDLAVPKVNPWRIVSRTDVKGLALGGGTWAVPSGGDSSILRFDSALACGNPDWRDYAFEVSVRFENVQTPAFRGAILLTRVQDSRTFCQWEWSGGYSPPKTNADVSCLVGGREIPLTSVRRPENVPLPEPNRWYRLRVEVQGGRLRTFVDGTLFNEAQGLPLRAGGVALVRVGLSNPSDLQALWDDVRVEPLPRIVGK